MERYKNKWFRLALEKDLKTQDLGVNIHCKEDGIHVTVPPPPPSGAIFKILKNRKFANTI